MSDSTADDDRLANNDDMTVFADPAMDILMPVTDEWRRKYIPIS
jgi:hypothetical protein